ncbi:MAG: hypothetical protein ACOH10_15015 [Rhodoglobus sp.]
MHDKITDITLTVPGHVSMEDPWLEGLLERTTQDIASHYDVDVMLGSYGCNDDGETFRSVRDQRDRLRVERDGEVRIASDLADAVTRLVAERDALTADRDSWRAQAERLLTPGA